MPGGAGLGEAEVLHEDQFGRGEAVVDLGEGQFGTGVGDAGLGVGVGGGGGALGQGREVVVGVDEAAAVAGDEGEGLHVERVVGVPVGVLGADDDGGGGPVGDAGAVEHGEAPGHGGHVADGLGGGLPPELGQRVAGTVEVVLLGDAGDDAAQVVLVDAVALGVGGEDEAEHGGGGEGAVGAVGGDGEGVEALVAAVLDLLATDGHGHVVGARRHGVAGLAKRLGPGGAVVLDAADRLAGEAQRRGERHAGGGGLGGAEPVGVDLVLGGSGRVEGESGGVDEEVVERLVPVLAERGAAHSDDRHAVADSV